MNPKKMIKNTYVKLTGDESLELAEMGSDVCGCLGFMSGTVLGMAAGTGVYILNSLNGPVGGLEIIESAGYMSGGMVGGFLAGKAAGLALATGLGTAANGANKIYQGLGGLVNKFYRTSDDNCEGNGK